jgi:putative transposase
MARGKDINIAPGELYHLYVRGVAKQNIFLDNRDYIRIIFLLLYLQSLVQIHNISVSVTHFTKHKLFNITNKKGAEILKNRTVELVEFTIMPNHLHLIVRELTEDGIPQYMKKVLGGYAKYFNAKYKKTGHVFQGSYNAVHIEDNEQLIYVSAYIHRNPRELLKWKNKEHLYPWSSYPDYLNENRWGEFLKTDIILGQFKKPQEYRESIEDSGAKEVIPKHQTSDV